MKIIYGSSLSIKPLANTSCQPMQSILESNQPI
jgi:hypothetical protein